MLSSNVSGLFETDCMGVSFVFEATCRQEDEAGAEIIGAFLVS